MLVFIPIFYKEEKVKRTMEEKVTAEKINTSTYENPHWVRVLLDLCNEYKIDLTKHYGTNTAN